MQQKISDAFEYSTRKLQTSFVKLNRAELDTEGTSLFNQRNTLLSYLNQVASQEGESVFPVDYTLLTAIRKKIGSDKVMFSVIDHYNYMRSQPVRLGIMATLGFPALPLYLSHGVFQENHLEVTTILIDIKSGGSDYIQHTSTAAPITKWYLRSEFYNLFTDILNTPQ